MTACRTVELLASLHANWCTMRRLTPNLWGDMGYTQRWLIMLPEGVVQKSIINRQGNSPYLEETIPRLHWVEPSRHANNSQTMYATDFKFAKLTASWRHDYIGEWTEFLHQSRVNVFIVVSQARLSHGRARAKLLLTGKYCRAIGSYHSVLLERETACLPLIVSYRVQFTQPQLDWVQLLLLYCLQNRWYCHP